MGITGAMGGKAARAAMKGGSGAAALAALLGAVDPVLNYQFTVIVVNATGLIFTGYFKEISGASMEIEAIKYKTFNRHTGLPETQILPGRTEPGTLTLKRGMTADLSFYLWAMEIVDGGLHYARSTVSVLTWSRAYLPSTLWTLYNAWPSKFSFGTMDTSQSEFQMEELTLIYEGFDLTQVGI